jgi:CHRD domain
MKKLSVLAALFLLFFTASLAFGQTATTIALNPQGTYQARGSATLTQQGNDVRIVVQLSGMTANQESAGHIHSGKCTPGGPVTVNLTPIRADAQGNGRAESVVPNTTIATLGNGNNYIQYHVTLSPPGAPIACGDIVVSSAPTSPPASGLGGTANDNSSFNWWLVALLIGAILAGGSYSYRRTVRK